MLTATEEATTPKVTDTVDEPVYDMSVDDVLKLRGFEHLKPATLAKWRQLGKGPKFMICGRKALYSRALIEHWKREEADIREHQRKKRPMALPIQSQRRDSGKVHRLGGHKVKRERGQGYRGASPT